MSSVMAAIAQMQASQEANHRAVTATLAGIRTDLDHVSRVAWRTHLANVQSGHEPPFPNHPHYPPSFNPQEGPFEEPCFRPYPHYPSYYPDGYSGGYFPPYPPPDGGTELGSAKKTKTAASAEVSSPRTESVPLNLRPSDFLPVDSLEYTPVSPTPSQSERTAPGAVVPFTQLTRADKRERINSALDILCTQANRDHIKEANKKKETNELYRSWMEFSIRMKNVAESRVALSNELQDLRKKEKKHFDSMWEAKEAKRLAELRLDVAKKKIETSAAIRAKIAEEEGGSDDADEDGSAEEVDDSAEDALRDDGGDKAQATAEINEADPSSS
ncbi:hypothetical protein BVRB_8g201240 [Beta vulgaris subsp. vulgaris]|uniref:Uncharacterized protein n=1 Tax=Beta vulgaris subsp. vulgaris TaxID=3555 RepID=A0A0J8B9G0_BETVV|nr:hypothetical protein BVRB_8g201240 [Beta vulgaris subsp. vulgaris]